ncbi:MAG: ATP-binding protein [Acidobacteria bacterium]|nr:ATP-binding protein [Acidobacteriota bacterium]
MASDANSNPRARRWVRPEDLAWVALFGVMAAVSPEQNAPEMTLLGLIAALQILEPRIPALETRRGNLASIFIKLLLGYLLIHSTGGLNSGYYLILLLPVVSAATSLGVLGTVLMTLIASATYLSLLLYIDWSRYIIEPYDTRQLGLRLVFIWVVGYVTHRLARANREEARKYQAAAEQLAEANRNLREAEAAVRRSERLAALGQMAAGLAHELRNPLGTMRASAEMLVRTVAAESEVAREVAGFISSEVDRTNSLITRFLDFARPLKLHRKPVELSEVIDRAVAQLGQHAPPYPVSVYKNYWPDIRPVEADGELLERVVYNLLLNAAQASPAGGVVTVKTRPLDGKLEISVIDRGSGIEPAQMENIFNPFFTTKPDGVGLGLAIVQKIVDEHGGRIAVESEAGRGSVFRVFLPAV